MSNTNIISNNAFKIEKLGKPEADYNSFKIMTLTNDIYHEIKDIWAPHYDGRDFDFGDYRDKIGNSSMKPAVKFDLK